MDGAAAPQRHPEPALSVDGHAIGQSDLGRDGDHRPPVADLARCRVKEKASIRRVGVSM